VPDQSQALQQNLVELANQCGMDESLYSDLADFAQLDPDELQEKIKEIEYDAVNKRHVADGFIQDGNPLKAEAFQALAEGRLKQAAVARLIHQAKVSDQPVNQQELLARLQSFKAAADNLDAVCDRADQQQRQLFQAEINSAIGPELIEMGFSAEEAAAVVKAIADYSLDIDQMESTVENAEKVARNALENLKNNNFTHQQPGLSDSDYRIQSAARRCLGMKFVQGQDGNVVVARPGAVRPLDEGALNAKIGAAKEHVFENGANAVIGERAQRAGEIIKRDLNNRARDAQQAPAQPAPQQQQPQRQPQQQRQPSDLRDLQKAVRRFDQRDLEAFKQAKQQADAMFERMGGVQQSSVDRAGMSSPVLSSDPNAMRNGADAALNKLENHMQAQNGQAEQAQGQKAKMPSVRDSLDSVSGKLKNAMVDAIVKKADEQKLDEVPPAIQAAYQAEKVMLDVIKKQVDNPDPNVKMENLEKQAVQIQARLDDMKKENPGLKQLDRNKVGQAIHNKVQVAAKAVANKIH